MPPNHAVKRTGTAALRAAVCQPLSFLSLGAFRPLQSRRFICIKVPSVPFVSFSRFLFSSPEELGCS